MANKTHNFTQLINYGWFKVLHNRYGCFIQILKCNPLNM